MFCVGNVYREDQGDTWCDDCVPEHLATGKNRAYWWPDGMAGEYQCVECEKKP